MRFLLLSLVGCAALAGCLAEAREPWTTPVVGPVTWEREPSMLPDFAGEGKPGYEFLEFHRHEMWSEWQRQEIERNPPRYVCAADTGLPLPSFPISATSRAGSDMPLCEPAYDSGTGRVLGDDEARAAVWAADAVLAQGGNCGSVTPFPADGRILVPVLGRNFTVELMANGTFLVDGTLWLRRGEVLKGTYALDYGASEHDREVKVVFDHAGLWLDEMVDEPDDADREPDVVPEDFLPPPPDEGTGPEAFVPRRPGTLDDLLGPLIDSGPADTLLHLRATFVGEDLTDLRFATAAGGARRDWFVASLEGEQVRMLAAEGGANAPVPKADLGAFEDTFFGTSLDVYRAGADGAPVGLAWAPGLAYTPAAAGMWADAQVPVPHTGRCDGGCVYVPAQQALGEGWRRVLVPREEAGDRALTVEVLAYEAVGPVRLAAFHALPE